MILVLLFLLTIVSLVTIVVILFSNKDNCVIGNPVCDEFSEPKECQCALKEEFIKKNNILANIIGKTYVSDDGYRTVTIKKDGEVITEEKTGACYKNYIQNEIGQQYYLSSSAFVDSRDGNVYIYSGETGRPQKAIEKKDAYVPKTENCINPWQSHIA